jgi:hypothetical protein
MDGTNHQLGCRWRDLVGLLAFGQPSRTQPPRLEKLQAVALQGLHGGPLLTGRRTCRHARPVWGAKPSPETPLGATGILPCGFPVTNGIGSGFLRFGVLSEAQAAAVENRRDLWPLNPPYRCFGS